MDAPLQDHRLGSGLTLVGYRGTGKTTVGRILAQRTSRPLFDTDAECESLAGCSIAELFAQSGEAAFRDLEQRVISHVTEQFPGAIVASGGGAILRPENVRQIREHGLVVWLKADPETLCTRISGDSQTRPALTAAGTLAEIEDVLTFRQSLYQAASHEAIDTQGLDPSQVADRVLSLLSWNPSS